MKTEKQNTSPFNPLKWAFVVLLIVGGLAANYFYGSQPIAIRLIGWIVLACTAAAIALQTAQGTQIITFAKQSRIELRKVVWPSRKETVQTTMIVVVMVFLVAMMLWGIDSVLLRVIGMLTGHRG